MAATTRGDDDFGDLLLSFSTGDVIAREGASDTQMYLIESGTVELVRSIGAAERVISSLGPGDFFGELSALQKGAVHLTSARAATAARVLPLDAAVLGFIVREQPELALRILHRLALRLRELDEQALRAHDIAAGAFAAERKPLPDAGDVVAAAARKGSSPPPVAALVHPPSGRRFELDLERRLSIGRFDPITETSPDIDLEVVDPQRSLSRRHAAIWRDGGTIYVCEEPGVANGTFVGSQRLAAEQPTPLRPRQTFRLGLVELRLDVGPPPRTS